MTIFTKKIKTLIITTSILLIVFLSSLTAYAQSTKTLTVTAPGTGAFLNQNYPIKVTTSDGKTAVIKFQSASPNVTLSATECTSTNGSCSIYFKSSVAGSYTLGVSAPGYESLVTSPVVVAGNGIIVSASPSKVTPRQDSTITVKLTDLKKDVVISFPGLQSSVISPQTCTTSSSGSCTITFNQTNAFSFGDFTVVARASGYSDGSTLISVVKSLTPGSPTPPGTPCVGSNCPAVTGNSYTLLAPITPEMGQTFDPTQDDSLSKYLNLMIKIFIGICAVLAMVMIVVGGLEYMTAEVVSNKEDGKHRIKEAIFGLLLALGSYMLLNTINPDLLKTDVTITNATLIVLGEDIPQTPVNGNYTKPSGGTVATGTGWTTLGGALTTLPAGVTTSPTGDCATVGQRQCTSVRGLGLGVINSLMSGCPTCRPVITAGTEFWLHSTNTSHKPGSSTVDIRANSDINTYITGNSSFPNNGKVYTKNGINYLAETASQTSNTTAPHWHAYQ